MSIAGILLIVGFAVFLVVFSSAILQLHPLLSLLTASIFVGLFFCETPLDLLKTLSKGFGDTLAHIGFIVILGCILGEILEKSGATQTISRVILEKVGRRDPQLAMIVLGAVVGVPVFCDAGFILLSRLVNPISALKKIPAKTLSIGLAGGLYTTHTLIPPTPGPVAAAGYLGAEAYIGMVMVVGVLVAVPVIFVIRLATSRMKFKYADPLELSGEPGEFSMKPWAAFFLLVFPILLISFGTLGRLNVEGEAGWLIFGEPASALLITVLLGLFMKVYTEKSDRMHRVSQGLTQVGPILILTGAGGAFGAVLKKAPIGELVGSSIAGESSGLFLMIFGGFLLSAVLKTAQGSSTSAIIISSSILAPVLVTFGIQEPFSISLIIMAIGGGAMTVSHANDSYFWVVSKFGNMEMKEAYTSFTPLTALQGVTVLLVTLMLALFV